VENRLGGCLRRAENFLAGLSGLCLILIVISVCFEIVMRYFFRSPLIWVVELTEYGLLYVTFLGSAWLLRQDGHVKVDVVLSYMSRTWRKRWAVLSSLMGLGVSLVLTVFGAITTWDHYIRGIFKPSVLEFPTWVPLLAIPLGSSLLSIRFGRMLFDSVARLKNDSASSREE